MEVGGADGVERRERQLSENDVDCTDDVYYTEFRTKRPESGWGVGVGGREKGETAIGK